MIIQIRPDTVFPCREAESDDVRSRDGQSVEEELDLFVLFLLLYPTHRTLGPSINTPHNVFLREEAALKDCKCEKYEIRDIFCPSSQNNDTDGPHKLTSSQTHNCR